MKRTIVHIVIPMILFVLLFGGCSDSKSENKGGTTKTGTQNTNSIYIDPDVALTGDGSQSSPYKTWAEVTFQAGYQYLQKKGTTAREQITINASGTSGSIIKVGAYGSGADPIIRGSEIEAGWDLESGNIFKKTINIGSGALGNVSEDGTMLKFLTWNSDATTTFTGASAGSYTYDYANSIVYVWCTDNVDPDGNHIMEVSRYKFGIHIANQDYINIENIHIVQASLHGIGLESVDHVNADNILVEKTGGAVILTGPIIYAGNGIEFGNDSNYGTVSNSSFSDIFDSGVSRQTFSDNMAASNFTFSNLTITRCGFAGIEIVLLYISGNTGSSMDNVLVQNVSISDSGTGWSGTRYWVDGGSEGEGRGIKIAADTFSDAVNAGNISNVTIDNVTISGSAGDGIFIAGNAGTVNIKRSRIHNNNRHGILVQELYNASLKLNLSSSLIYNNGTNNGANNKSGVAYIASKGQGFNLFQNTFYDNAYFSFIVWLHGGDSQLKNNIFHASSSKIHLLINDPSSDIQANSLANNYFREYADATADISILPSAYHTAADFNANTHATENIGDSDGLLNSDFTLQNNTSACYQNGETGLGINIDFIGNSYLDPPTIGAFEYY